ncbi:hypothetical protein, partial [Nocardia wallacei]|uniref:hypothetical protein n=1 Tax=Nocardia wallacei TaxID=480035 RepID=UPI002453FD37
MRGDRLGTNRWVAAGLGLAAAIGVAEFLSRRGGGGGGGRGGWAAGWAAWSGGRAAAARPAAGRPPPAAPALEFGDAD